jgi:hypothetical protein
VICSTNPATTKEHIPCQAVFLKKPAEYITVPACDECNNSSKLHDEYLRQVMSGGSQTPEGMDVWTKKVVPKLKNLPKTQAGLRNKLTKVPVGLPDIGLIELPGMKLEMHRIEINVKKMVRGLYWLHTGLLMHWRSRSASRCSTSST